MYQELMTEDELRDCFGLLEQEAHERAIELIPHVPFSDDPLYGSKRSLSEGPIDYSYHCSPDRLTITFDVTVAGYRVANGSITLEEPVRLIRSAPRPSA